MEKKHYLTQEGLEKLKGELEYLKNTKRREIAQKLKKAISFGDLSENAAYSEAKDAQAFLEGRILELKKIIGSAEIVQNHKRGKVELGSQVLLRCGQEELSFQIVGDAEGDPLKGRISHKSPVGQALMEKKEGSIVRIKNPDGAVEYKIIKIS